MDIKECIDKVVLFNEIAGNLDHINHDSLVAQAKCVREEGIELLEAVESGVENEILKEAVDVLVTIHGFVKMLEEQGYDVLSAWNSVNINNLSKFPNNIDVATDSISMYEEDGIKVVAEENDHYQVYVLKNAAGKVMKPLGYKKANVSFYTPNGILPKVSEHG